MFASSLRIQRGMEVHKDAASTLGRSHERRNPPQHQACPSPPLSTRYSSSTMPLG
jgi:hypothetical protein